MSQFVQEIRELDAAIARFEEQKAGIEVEIGNRKRKREMLFGGLSEGEKVLLQPSPAKAEIRDQKSEASQDTDAAPNESTS